MTYFDATDSRWHILGRYYTRQGMQAAVTHIQISRDWASPEVIDLQEKQRD